MFLSLLTLAIALSLSAIAAFYSIAGLAAIFAAAVVPIMIMGSVLEVAKLVVTVWLHEYWHRCRLTMKLYLVPAVGILMIITSMGIFGFLSKAHSDQSLVSGDVQAKIAVYDEKIKTAKDNIDANRKALKQMDEAVDQVMGRSTTETGADKSVALRRSQQKDRGRLLAEIEAEQKKVSILAEQRAPIAAEVRKVEAEVGPIKYIAAFVYGDNPDANLLEKAVTWVIIIIVAVFDPLAIMMLLAATESLKWRKEDLEKTPAYEEDDGPLTEEQIAQLKKSVEAFGLPEGEVAVKTELFPKDPETSPVEILSIEPDTIPCVKCGIPLVDVPSIGFVCANPDCDPVEEEVQEEVQEEVDNDSEAVKEAKRRWKADNPKETLKNQRRLVDAGFIDHSPWEDYLNTSDEDSDIPYGDQLPESSAKGDMYLNITYQPTKLFKYNGQKWIEVDKKLTDRYVYNDSYIDYLISKISSGEYDPELLNDSERSQIEEKLKQGPI